MDCFYHHAVPSIAPCAGCRRPICATCRSEAGDCPGCRLAARIDAAATPPGELPGRVPFRPAPPPPESASAPPHGALAEVRPESRALVALSYPFWPLALLALLDGAKAPFVRRQALQALGFNAGVYALWIALTTIASIPVLGISAWPLLPLVIPVAVVASVIYGVKVWHGEDVRIPIVTDLIDGRRTPDSSRF